MLSQSRKAKGRLLQQAICKMITEGIDGLSPDDVVSRPMGSPGADCIMSPLAQKLFPVTFECKNTKKQPGPDALEQATFNCYEHTYPAVAWKPPRKGMEDSIMICKVSDFIKIINLLNFIR